MDYNDTEESIMLLTALQFSNRMEEPCYIKYFFQYSHAQLHQVGIPCIRGNPETGSPSLPNFIITDECPTFISNIHDSDMYTMKKPEFQISSLSSQTDQKLESFFCNLSMRCSGQAKKDTHMVSFCLSSELVVLNRMILLVQIIPIISVTCFL